MRSKYRWISGLCVTITMVLPSRWSSREEVHDLDRRLAVERAGGLVGEDQRRLVDERARDGHALLLTARELARQVPAAVGEPDALEDLARPGALLAPTASLDGQRQRDVLERRQVRHEVERLEDEPEVLAAEVGEPLPGSPYRSMPSTSMVPGGRVARPPSMAGRCSCRSPTGP